MGNIQAKNVPDDVHEAVRQKARHEGLSVSEYLVRLMRRDIAIPSFDIWLEELHKDPPAPQHLDIHAALDAVRDEIEGR